MVKPVSGWLSEDGTFWETQQEAEAKDNSLAVLEWVVDKITCTDDSRDDASIARALLEGAATIGPLLMAFAGAEEEVRYRCINDIV